MHPYAARGGARVVIAGVRGEPARRGGRRPRPAGYDGPVASTERTGVPDPLRWGLALLAGVAGGLAIGFVLGLARPRTWPDPAALG